MVMMGLPVVGMFLSCPTSTRTITVVPKYCGAEVARTGDVRRSPSRFPVGGRVVELDHYRLAQAVRAFVVCGEHGSFWACGVALTGARVSQ